MTYKKHEWTAFTEADLLGAGSDNGSSIGHGDSFTMPGAATVTMSTWDDDGSLSGDNYYNENANDSTGQYARVDGARVGSQMYAESYHVLHGSDGKTYYLIEIEVEGYSAPGLGDDFFTFYGEVPPAGVELTVTQTCNVTGCWVDYSCLGAGSEAPANTPPTFTNLPADGIICVDENTTFVIDSAATDADGDALTYEIVGGRDASFFEIDAHTGELTFIGAPDFEAPQSGGNNNTYDVTIKVSDDNGGSDTKALWVKVKDVDEGNCIVIEAEDMHEWGFRTVHGDQASGGELVKLDCANGNGELSTTFNGATGEYDLSVFAQDENDGQSTIMVKVNGAVVGTLTLDNDNNGGGSNNGAFSKFTLENIQINAGDTVTLWVDGDHGEYVRIDKIELCQDGENCPDGFSLQDFSGVATGTTVADQFAGFTVTAQRNGDAATSENDAMIFDTANPTGGDADLGFDNLGNAIIISEDNDASDPDDNAGGGTITFDFDNPSDLHDVKLLDIEGTGTFIELFDEAGALIKRIDVTGTGDNTVQTVLLDAVDVAQMVITLNTSGGVDDLCFRPGEAPALGSLSGRYFIDENNNDLDDAEPGVEGVTVELLNADGTGTGITTLTAADGSYSFDDLVAGTYGVKFTDTVSGLTLVDANQGDDTIDSDAIDIGGGMSTINNIVVVSGADTPDNDAGVEDAGTASVGDTVWFDANGNGVLDGGETGINGVNVTLTGAGDDGVFGTGDDTTDATVTTGNGSYLFDGLKAGDYKVTFDTTTTAGLILTAASAVAADAANNDSDADQTNGMTDVFTLSVGEAERDIDAGYVDPGTASLGDKVFFDANGNGQQDAGEAGVNGVTVTLFDENGNAIDTAETMNGGMYLFDGLAAGEYSVAFDIEDTFVFTDQDQGDDATDSDADVLTGRTGTYTLGIGEENLTVDAGLIAANKDPEPQDDAGMTCADDLLVLDVLANDGTDDGLGNIVDSDGDVLSITAVDGQAIVDGGASITTAAGTLVSLVDGELVIDGEAAYASLDINQSALETISYTVDDGNGGTASANVDVTFKGDANSVEGLAINLPASATIQLVDENAPVGSSDQAFTMQISNGNAQIDGIYAEAYCISIFDPYVADGFGSDVSLAPAFDNADIYLGIASELPTGVLDMIGINGATAADNLDEITWILNQDFASQGFTDAEIQGAIWALTDGESIEDDFGFAGGIFVAGGGGDVSDAQIILDLALVDGSGFEAQDGDLVGVIIDPNDSEFDQPFIVGIAYDSLDCIC